MQQYRYAFISCSNLWLLFTKFDVQFLLHTVESNMQQQSTQTHLSYTEIQIHVMTNKKYIKIN